MGAPQIIFITITAINLLLHARDHGKPKEGTDNFWVAAISSAMMLSILYWGGFFS